MPYEHYVVRSNRFADELHTSLRGCAIPFSIITGDTSTHQIFPRVSSSPCFWDDMIDGKRIIGFSTILTSVIVPPQDVLTGENDFLVRNTNINRKSHDTWKWHGRRNGSEHFAFVGFNQLSLPQPQQNNCFLHVANTQWLVVVIEHEHFAAEFAICAKRRYFDAEDSIPSFHYISELAQMFLEEYRRFALKI
jgi:hypothetical protein